MASTSYIQLIDKIQAFCDAHYQIERFDAEFGEQRPNLATESEKYPYVFLEPTSVDGGYDLRNFSVTITCYDIIQKDRDNINTIVSDCEQILQDLFAYFNQGKDDDIIALSNSKTPLNNYDLDYVAGWSMNIVFELEGWCTNAIPMTPITPGSAECEDANYTLKDSAGSTISSGTIASGSSADITAPDGEVRVKKSDGVLISAVTVKSDEAVDYNVADSNIANSDATYSKVIKATDSAVTPDIDINFNGVSQGQVPSVKDISVDLEDGAGNPVTPDAVSLVGETLTIDVTVGGAPVGAETIKSGQTVSYQTNDDGDLEKGRDTDFLTLSSNNVFGNTNRFTDELGTQVYTNGIVIDHATDNGSNILGIELSDNGVNVDWSTAVTNASATSIGTFTTGWRLPNVKELEQFAHYGVSRRLNYAPFNDAGNFRFWTSTSNPGNTANGIIIYNQHGGSYQQAKTTSSNSRYRSVRNFTYAELGV